MDLDRRTFLQALGLGGVGAVAVGASPAAVLAGSASAPAGENPSDDGRMGVLVDLTKCIGCRRCEFACQEAAGFDPPPLETFEDKSVLARHRRPTPDCYTTINRFTLDGGNVGPESPGPSGAAAPLYTKSNCLHCNDPACASACLVGALQKRPDGPVVYDPGKCMGCRYCMVACPFGIPAYDYDNALTPQVRKCNLCAHRVPSRQQAPACVTICPEEVLTYGRRADLLALAHERIREQPNLYVDQVYGEHEAGGTSWLYLSSVPFEDIGFLKLGSMAPPHLTETVQHAIFKFFVPPLALYGLLGLIMRLSRPLDRASEPAEPASHDAARQRAHAPALGAPDAPPTPTHDQPADGDGHQPDPSSRRRSRLAEQEEVRV